MRKRTPIRVLLVAALTLALLPMLSTFAPGGQVVGFTTAAPVAADQIWYQSVGRASATAPCEESTTTELAAGWTKWAPSWDTWVNGGNGGFVCNRQITWAFDSVPPSSSGSTSLCRTTSGGSIPTPCALGAFGPGGGLVFLITGGRTYEMAPKTWGAASEDTRQAWTTTAATCYAAGGTAADRNCQTNNLYPGTAGEQSASTTASLPVGMGAANTDAVIARMNALTPTPVTTTAYAAGLARGYSPVVSGVTINDWFLPSKDELNAMCNYSRNPTTPPTGTCTGTQNVAFAGGDFGFDETVSYWSSSQVYATVAWYQYFDNGFQSNDNKLLTDRVRPVRAF